MAGFGCGLPLSRTPAGAGGAGLAPAGGAHSLYTCLT